MFDLQRWTTIAVIIISFQSRFITRKDLAVLTSIIANKHIMNALAALRNHIMKLHTLRDADCSYSSDEDQAIRTQARPQTVRRVRHVNPTAHHTAILPQQITSPAHQSLTPISFPWSDHVVRMNCSHQWFLSQQPTYLSCLLMHTTASRKKI